jgi:ankyrin repeat protein
VLYKFKIDYNAVDLDGNTALHFAAEGGYKDIIQYLLSIYCTVKKNKEGKTPIDDCCDESLKNIFIQYGFKENGDYEEYKDTDKQSSKNYVKNKLEHQIIPR